MAPRDRKGAQLSVELPPELLARLRAHAAAADRPVAAVVRRWIEAGLTGALEVAGAAAPSADSELLARVAALEAAVSDLQRSASPERVSQAPRASEPVPLGRGQLEILGAGHLHPPAELEPASPERVNPAPLSGDAVTTAELAQRTGSNRAGWNNWAAGPGRVGQVRHHRTAGSWRLIGKAPAPGGGPERWLWEPA